MCRYCRNYLHDAAERRRGVCHDCVVSTDRGGRWDEFDN